MGKERGRLRLVMGICGSLAIWACHSGGGGGPDVSFSFENGALALAEGLAPTSIQIVLHSKLPALEEDVTVEVVDLGSGSATSGTDYAAFAPQTITFLAGATDGAMQAILLDPLDDELVEGSGETIALRLQNPVGGGVSGPATLTVSLTDEDVAAVGFATASSATMGEQNGPEALALELDCDPGVTLAVDVSVRVSDLRTGSANPPGDYASFAARTVVFSAGAGDGALEIVDVVVADDTITEGNETVEIGLSSPSAACVLGPIDTHVLTIEDDDLGGNSAFLGTEGATGTGNSLSYDELIPLGSQNVGAGPNAGTLLRIANGGGQPMAVGTPSVIGSHPTDFMLEVESSSTSALSGDSSALIATDERAPVVARGLDSGPGLALSLDPQEMRRLGTLERVFLHDFPLPDLGPVTLEIVRQRLPLSPDAKLVVDDKEIPGGPRTLLGDLQIWSGSVLGLPGSHVFLAVSGTETRGYLELPVGPDRFVHVFPDGPEGIRLLRDSELNAIAGAPPQICAGDLVAPGQTLLPTEIDPDGPSTSALTLSDCRLAIETDFQLYGKLGSSTALTNYVTELVSAISAQYAEDVQTTLSIAYLGIHTDSDDGWTTQEAAQKTPSLLLAEFRAAWGTNWPVQADLAHFMSGSNLGGGVAYVNVLCSAGFGFGVSGNMNGTINWNNWTGQPAAFTWDFVVVAHELGHNFGSSHTQDFCPPLDVCYTNCTGGTSCGRGTLMSYCHACGGMSNIDLEFHPVCANIMRQRVNASCLGDAMLDPGDYIQYSLRFNPLTTAGARSATVEFAHDASNVTQPFRLRLSGTAN